MKKPNFFLTALVINLSLMVAYVVYDYYDLRYLLMGAGPLQWTPFTITVWFTFSTPEVSYAHAVWTYNWSFFAVLAIIGVNLLVIRVLEQKLRRQLQNRLRVTNE